MDSTFTLITFEEAGGVVRLFNPEQCVAAVDEGRIVPDTLVTIYREDGAISQSAREFPLLKALFADRASRRTPTATPLLPGSLPSPSPWTSANTAAIRPQPERVPDTPPAIPAISNVGTPPAGIGGGMVKRKPASFTRVLVTVGGVVLLVAGARSCSHKTNSLENALSTVGSDAGAASAAESDASRALVKMYVLRDVNVQRAPLKGKSLGKLHRGDAVTGFAVAGARDPSTSWFKIKSGPQAGRFIWAINLGTEQPPDLDLSYGGAKPVLTPGTMHVAPSNDAADMPQDAAVAAGTVLDVVGRFGSWAEVRAEHGGVGYVPVALFDAHADQGNAVADTDDTETHDIVIGSGCSSKAFTVALYYQDPGGEWHANNGAEWNVARAAPPFYPTVANRRLTTSSDQFYYAITAVDGAPITADGDTRVSYGGRVLPMTRAKVRMRTNGDYEVNWTC